MPSTLSWTINVHMSGAPAISASRAAATLEGYDHVQVVVEPDGKEKTVEVQPGPADRVSLLLISSSHYGKELSFKASDGKKDSAAVLLTEPQVLAGSAVGLLGVAPNLLKITNTIKDQPVTVEVFAFRNASA